MKAHVTLLKGVLRWLGRSVYGGILPVEETYGKGAERYLEDLWADAPWFVALAHTVLALTVLVLPPVILGKFRLFSSLGDQDRERMQQRMIRSRIYFIRMIFYGVRGHAMVATLRDPEARRVYLRGKEVLPPKRSVGY